MVVASLHVLLFISLSMALQLRVNASTPKCPLSTSFATSSTMKESHITPEDETPRCDQTSGLNYPGQSSGWFRLEGPGGAGIISHQPKRSGICGATYPGWIQGKVPRQFGKTTGKLCYRNPPSGFTCPEGFDCHDFLKIDMYNCDGRYLIYHLHLPPTSESENPPSDCEKAFCTTDIGPCELGKYKTIVTLPEMTVTHHQAADAQPRCDESTDYVDGKTWIRLQGSSGTEIIHEQPINREGVCGTRNPGWVVGTKPTKVGTVARRTLCYSKGKDGECCDGRPIDIINCKRFMIYRLHPFASESSSPSSSSSSESSPSNPSSCPSQCCKAFCVEKPIYDVCKPMSYDTISKTSKRQSDDQYADGRTWWRIGEGQIARVISQTKPTETGQCNSENPGWMQGTVPQFLDGIVQRKLCYFDDSSTECPNPRTIDVANCGTFLVYRFYAAPTPPNSSFCIEPSSPDPCYYLPCQNGGTCALHANKVCYTCSCPAGMGGANCEIDNTGVDECASNPCQNGGTCHDRLGRYACSCASGFTGTNCETEIDKCSPNPCENGGTCIKKGDSYECECPDTYSGYNCETSTPKDPCNPNPCKNYGECKGGVCECEFAWCGPTCEDDKQIEEILSGIDIHYKKRRGCGFFCWLGGFFGGVAGALIGFLPKQLVVLASGLGSGLGSGLAAGLGGISGSLGNLGTTLDKFNNLNGNKGKNPKNSNSKIRCPRMNVGSALKGLKSGIDKCKSKYDKKVCTPREKAKPNKPQQPDKPKPTSSPPTATDKPTDKPTEEPTEEPTSACSATCSAVQGPEHGEKTGDKTSCGDSVSFSCENGYHLSGCTEPQCKITCQDDGQWSGQPPTCVKATCGGLITLSSSHSRHTIEKRASSPITDCNWAVQSDTPTSITVSLIDFNFPDSISSQDTCKNYLEIVTGSKREKYCGEKNTNNVHVIMIYNQGLIRFHSSLLSSSFKIQLSLQQSCAIQSDLSRRAGGGCSRPCTASSNNANQWPKHLPILFDGSNEIKLPTKLGVLSLNQGERLTARCTNTKFSNYAGKDEVVIECDGGKLKIEDGANTDTGKTFKDISCRNTPTPEIWEDSGNLHIGWKKNTITQMTVTYDKAKKRPLYVEHSIIGPIALWKENDHARPDSFTNLAKYLKKLKYPPMDITKLTKAFEDVSEDGYKIKRQYSDLELLSNGLGLKYIDCCEGAKYLVKGHLAPNADFGFQSWRDATFFMVNVAPQWQGINAGNWRLLEDEIRNYAYERSKNIVVYTGVYGTLQLELNAATYDINVPQPNSPVPTHFWKIVYDKGLKAAVAFVMLNNPYATLDALNYPTGDDLICPKQCDYLGSGKFLEKGILMCCSYEELAAVIGSANVPSITGLSINLTESTNPMAISFGKRLKVRIK